MGKIRVKDLATRMGIPSQDLVFKLKSIGARIESEETPLDTDVIQAILQGKRLTQPREVILRDSEEEVVLAPEEPTSEAAPAAARPHRRAMIQRVSSQRIRNLDQDFAPGTAPVAPVTRPATAASAAGPHDAALEAEAADPAAAGSEGAPQAGAEAKGSATASPPTAEETSAAAATPPKKPEKLPQGRVDSNAPLRPSRSKARARLIARPDEPIPGQRAAPPPPPRRPPASRPPATRPAGGGGRPPMGGGAPPASRPPGRPGRPGMGGPPPSYGARRRPSRRPMRPGREPIQEMRRYQRAPRSTTPPEELIEAKPTSERGRRRAERKETRGPAPVTSAELPAFKEERPDAPVTISEGMTVREFAEKLGVKSKELIKALVMRGVMANINHILDPETAKSLASDLGVEVMEVSFEEEVQLQQESELASEKPVGKAERAPVVTVMGHVDHGKTTLLDTIRRAEVAAGEAGGITQHIGAYHVDVGDKQVVFLDTPGHEAFTLMRARGANVTDLVVLVVAADDGVMPQTIEAIDHAKAANVPLIVAVNKIDKDNANPDRVKKELSDRGLIVEEWGGDLVSVGISALKNQGIDELLEMLLLQAELLELKASPELPAQGGVLEARKDIGRGMVATVLVQDGTLRIGDIFVAGSTWGRVRSMRDDRGRAIKEAGPATPIEVTGFNSLPSAGDTLQVVENEIKARGITEFRHNEERQKELAPRASRMSLSQLFDKIEGGETKELPLVLKGDVHGSVEVLRDTVEKLSTEKVKIKVIHSSVGAITTNDVILASASDAIIIGFNVRPERKATQLAEKEEVEIRLHTVIYELTDELKKAMAGLLDPTFVEEIAGAAEVRETFKVPKFGVIAGSYVTEGVIPRNANARLLRDNRVIWEGKLGSLRRFKDDASEVRNGFECGIGLEGYQDIKPGDVVEAYVRKEVAATLE